MIASPIAPISTINTIRNINSVLTPRRSTTAARLEPLRTLSMATSQAQARVASSSAKGGGKTRRASTRLMEKDDGNAEEEEGTVVNGYRQGGGEGRKEQQERSKKRKADYDEQVGDFVFSRAEPKKQKPSAVSGGTITEQPIMEEPEPRQQQQTGQKRKTRAKAADTTTDSTPSTRPQRKTSKQNSVEPAAAEDIVSPKRTRRKINHSDPASGKTKKKKSKVDETKDPDRMGDVEMNGNHTPHQEQENHATTISLPFADTPVISRNKEMRMGKGKGQRRSSLGMRGRRASSLIESGASNALPHDKVSTADFYKHIGNEGLPEPRRMSQLLTWCATRAIGDKPSGSRSEDESARLAARVIQEELLKDFSNRSELSNWFNREESAPPKVVVKKPNPKNIQNADKIKELEQQIHRLQEERQALSALLRPPSIPPITKPLAPPQEPEDGERYPASQRRRKHEPEPIDPSLLDPSQLPFLNILTPAPPTTHPHPRDQEKQKQRPRHREPTSSQKQPPPQEDTSPDSSSSTSHHPSEISTRLSHLASSLPSTIDAFASGIHDIELYRDSADRVAGRVLGICAKRLEERDRVIGGRWDGGSSSHSPSEGMDTEETSSSSGSGDRKGKGKSRDGGGEEDIGLVLGALSRVERR